MEVTNAAQAEEWVRSWGGRPGRGYLESSIRGTRARIAYAVEYRHEQMEADDRAALAVLERVARELGHGDLVGGESTR